MRFYSSRKGFTLMELLVVISIIGLLASVIMTSVQAARSKARDSKRITDVKQMMLALEYYRDANDQYPAMTPIHSGQSNWQSSALATALDPYMKDLPTDPINTTTGFSYTGSVSNYNYAYFSSPGTNGGKYYVLIFRLENQRMDYDLVDGVKPAPSANTYDYPTSGGVPNDGYIITWGMSNE